MRLTRAKLYTSDDEFVADITTPPFEPPADVIMWGNRTFVFRQPILGIEPYGEYREGMTWHCTELATVPA